MKKLLVLIGLLMIPIILGCTQQQGGAGEPQTESFAGDLQSMESTDVLSEDLNSLLADLNYLEDLNGLNITDYEFSPD